ncbi:coiled-coil domain-containing protein 137 [Ciona intestinalis]
MGRGRKKVKDFSAFNKAPKNKLKFQKDQKVPRKVEEIVGDREKFKNSFQDKKNKKKDNWKGLKFKPQVGETEHQFVSRMNDEVKFVITKNKHLPYTQPEMDEEKKKKNNKRLNKLKEKKKKLKELQQEQINEDNLFKDKVLFNEVVLEPPQLKTKPRKSNPTIKKYNFLDKFETIGNKIVAKT